MFGPQAGGGGGDFVEQIKDWWNNCPFYTKFLVYATTGLSIMGIFTKLFLVLFVNVPAWTFGSFQIWRLVTSPFVSQSIIEILFVYIAYLPMLTKQERECGTVKTIVDFFLKNLEVNVLFNVACYLFSVLSSSFQSAFSYGLWCIFFVNLVERSMRDPDGLSQILCLPIQIKNRYYPIALLLFFSLISGSFRLDMLAAVGVGYLHLAYLDGFYSSKLTEDRYRNWENGCFSFLKGYPNFVPLGGGASTGFSVQGSQNRGGFRPAQIPSQPTQTLRAAQSNPFGGRGVAIGGGDIEAAPSKPQRPNYAQLDETDDSERQ